MCRTPLAVSMSRLVVARRESAQRRPARLTAVMPLAGGLFRPPQAPAAAVVIRDRIAAGADWPEA